MMRGGDDLMEIEQSLSLTQVPYAVLDDGKKMPIAEFAEKVMNITRPPGRIAAAGAG